MNIYQILKRPIDTEKTRFQAESYEPQYAFEVDGRANKKQIKNAVEQIFDVDVIRVRTMRVKPKLGRYGRRVVTRKSAWKKAIVTIAEGQRLDIFEGI